jgi:pimeloyl-ACP methyl ester carboxylesterase
MGDTRREVTGVKAVQTGIDKFVTANGIRLHYVEWPGKDGTAWRLPVILLHSGLGAGHCWDLVGPHLAAGGFHTLAPDLRGRGLSEHPPGGYDLRTIAEDVVAFSQAVSAGRIAIVGHSYGAYVALAAAALYPNLFTQLVLLDGGIWSAEGQTWEEFAQQQQGVTQSYQSLAAYLETQREGAALFWNDEVARALVSTVQIDPDGTVRESMPPVAWQQTLASMWRYRPESLYSHIACPTLVVVTELPNSFPKDVRNQKLEMNERFLPEAMAGLRLCRVQVMEQTHHEVPFHKPEELANLITSFVRTP